MGVCPAGHVESPPLASLNHLSPSEVGFDTDLWLALGVLRSALLLHPLSRRGAVGRR